MDDFVVAVRQIAQYPAVTAIGPNDVVLLQQSGVGGPYKSATASQFLSGMPGASVGMTTGKPVAGLATSFVTSQLGARQGYNWYLDQSGIQRYLQGGVAGIWSFGQDGQLAFSIAPSGTADQQMLFNSPIFQMASDGQLTLQRQISVGRDPINPTELTTLQWVQKNTVTSFNGHSGAITLQASDINTALNIDPCDQIATESWVNSQVCNAITDWYNVAPFVFTFNGRVGDITLTNDDIEAAFFANPGTYPTAPNPPLGDASHNIATTAFVDESLEDWANTINNSWNSADYEILNILQTQYAPLASPSFTGLPSGPTANPGTSTAQLATTAFVMQAVASSVAGVASFNTRTGAVVLTQADIVGANGWNNVNLTGTPMAPTAPNGTQTGQIATTAFVLQEIAAINAGVISFNGRSGVVSLNLSDITGAGGAPIASPALTGTPTAPTAAVGTNSTQLATTAFVLANTVTSFNGRTGAITLTANDITAAGGAAVNSPIFTGTPQAPTATAGTSTQQLATTAFVMSAIGAVSGVTTFNTRSGAVTLTAADVSAATGVIYSAVQSLADAQQVQARTNVYAAPFDAMESNNIVINGGMVVSQQNGTTAVPVPGTGAATYIVDQWMMTSTVAGNGQQVATAPPGYTNALQFTATAALTIVAGTYSNLQQRIEGTRWAKLAFGSAYAQPVTIGFWSYASVTGTASVALVNGAANRSYVANYQIAAANTWQWNTVTIPGDTVGTWAKDTTTGTNLMFCFAAGSTYQASPNVWSAGNFYGTAQNTNFFPGANQVAITGVVVLPGTEAPSAARAAFAMRPYGEDVVLCQRYYQTIYTSVTGYSPVAGSSSTTGFTYSIGPMRATPTVTIGAVNYTNATGAAAQANSGASYSVRFFAYAVAAGNFYAGTLVTCDARL